MKKSLGGGGEEGEGEEGGKEEKEGGRELFRDKYVVSADSFLGDYEIAAIWIQTEQNFALTKMKQTLQSPTGLYLT